MAQTFYAIRRAGTNEYAVGHPMPAYALAGGDEPIALFASEQAAQRYAEKGDEVVQFPPRQKRSASQKTDATQDAVDLM